MRCTYCDSEAVKTYSIDIDIPSIHLCDNQECGLKLLLDLFRPKDNNENSQWTTNTV